MVAHLFSKLSIPSLFLAELRYPSLSLLASLSPRSPRSPSLSLSPIGHDASRLLGGRLPLATMHNTPVHLSPSPLFLPASLPPLLLSIQVLVQRLIICIFNARKEKSTNQRITIMQKWILLLFRKGREELGNATQLYRYIYIYNLI